MPESLLCPVLALQGQDLPGDDQGPSLEPGRDDVSRLRREVHAPTGENHQHRQGALKRRRYKDGPPLRENPAAFRRVFGDCEYPPEAIRSLVSAIALREVKDYFTPVESIRDERARLKAVRLRLEAERYLFDPRYQALCELWDFDVVCKTIGIDPAYARRGMRARKPGDLKGIMKAIRKTPRPD